MPAGRRRGADEVAIIEAIYDFSPGRDDWLCAISRQVNSNLGASLGALMVEYERAVDGRYAARPLYVDTPPAIEEGYPAAIAPIIAPDSPLLAILAKPPALTGFVETFPKDHPYRQACAPYLSRAGAEDTNLLTAFDTGAHLVTISSFFPRVSTPRKPMRARYQRVSAHLAAALRLRRAFERSGHDGVEAVFDPGGRSHDARGQARSRLCLEQLRKAVVARETARSKLRREDPDRALGLWKALVAGRWSLLDRFDSDGRRFIVAMSNENIARDPRALTPREEQIAQLAATGLPNGEIAYAVGVTAECVSAHLHSALRKLACRTRRDLIRMLEAGHYEFTLDVGGAVIGVLAEPARARTVPPELTPAEARVFEGLRAGETNAQIAARNGTSVRTVANQVASILRKTHTSSRYDLMRSV